MKLDLFASRIHRAYFVGGVVRIEFASLQADAKGEASADAETTAEDVSFTVSIPMSGFTRSVGVLRNVYQDLIQRGILRKQEGGQQGAGPQGAGPGGPGPGGMRGGQPRLRDLTADDEGTGGGQPLV
ncbi:hypothetical protein ACUN0C_16895 [Faunimonas sp. B44]|uniref:hypothetical protein n=1 Tax=Faunimonas sp. B44 TaxID=3461493 RepID=UPI004043A43A